MRRSLVAPAPRSDPPASGRRGSPGPGAMTSEPQLQLPELNVPTSAIYTGDNLDVLRGINSDCVDLIYLDPPFNSNKRYGNPMQGAFRDEWTMDDAKDEWVESIEESHASLNLLIRAAGKIHGEAMQGYLTFMAVRLIEMRRVLKPAGSIYLHCDPTASHYLKGAMDSVFGPGNFRNEITWRRTHSKNALTTRYGSNHDVILAYSKAEWTFNKEEAVRPFGDKEVPAGYRLDRKTKRCYALSPVHGPGSTARGDSGQPAMFRGALYTPPEGRHWLVPSGRRVGETTTEGWARLDAEGRMYLAEGGKFPQYIRYLDEMNGIDLDDVWTDIQIPGRSERTGYPTQKPLALLERIIRASTNPGDVVLDPFCGCATACVAAETMTNLKNAELPEKRRWIGIDVSPLAYDLVLRRLQRRDVGLREKGKESANVTHTGEVRHLTLEYEGPDDDRVLIGGDIPRRTDLERRLRRRSPDIKDKLYEMQQGKCNADAEFLDKKHFTLDHIVPQSKEGPDIDGNLQLLCNHHNVMKNNGTMADLDRRMRGDGETPWDNRPLRVAEAEREFAQPERRRRRARLV